MTMASSTEVSTADCGSNQPAGNAPSRARLNPFKPRSMVKTRRLRQLKRMAFWTSYRAKHQFAVYGNFEDLNQNISGDWPVTIEKATVELDFPSGMPPRSSISADTGSDSTFQFDCGQTNLPSGVRFETSHSIPPHERLFISARFTRGYFVADAAEDGMHAVFEKYPLLSPAIAVVVTLVVLSAVAYLLAPTGMPKYDAAPRWVHILVVTALPGTAAFALRLMY